MRLDADAVTLLLMILVGAIGVAILAGIRRWRRHRQIDQWIRINDRRIAELLDVERHQNHGR